MPILHLILMNDNDFGIWFIILMNYPSKFVYDNPNEEWLRIVYENPCEWSHQICMELLVNDLYELL